MNYLIDLILILLIIILFFFEGQHYEAYSLLIDIFNTANKEIIIIDNYAGKELLDLLKDNGLLQ